MHARWGILCWTAHVSFFFQFQRATVQNYLTGALETAAYRISKSSWLKEHDHPVVATINRRINAITGNYHQHYLRRDFLITEWKAAASAKCLMQENGPLDFYSPKMGKYFSWYKPLNPKLDIYTRYLLVKYYAIRGSDFTMAILQMVATGVFLWNWVWFQFTFLLLNKLVHKFFKDFIKVVRLILIVPNFYSL